MASTKLGCLMANKKLINNEAQAQVHDAQINDAQGKNC